MKKCKQLRMICCSTLLNTSRDYANLNDFLHNGTLLTSDAAASPMRKCPVLLPSKNPRLVAPQTVLSQGECVLHLHYREALYAFWCSMTSKTSWMNARKGRTSLVTFILNIAPCQLLRQKVPSSWQSNAEGIWPCCCAFCNPMLIRDAH